MNTDELSLMLATGAEAVDARAPQRRFALAVGSATLVCIAAMALLLGTRPALVGDFALPMFWLKETFCILLAAGGLYGTARIARPGASLGWTPALLAVPLVAMWALALLDWFAALPAARIGMLQGISWTACTFSIATLSLPVFVAVVWVLKGLAPTRLRLAGAMAGFASGATSALVYTLHCPELAAPFLALWYVLGMLIPATAGALLGPRLLRW